MKDDGIHIVGIIQKAVPAPIGEAEMFDILDAIIELLEARDLTFGGGVKLVDADQESSTD